MSYFDYKLIKLLIKRNLGYSLYLYACLKEYFGESEEIEEALRKIRKELPPANGDEQQEKDK